MATFNIVLDRRVKKKDNKFNLSVRVVNKKDVVYIPITKLTEDQYKQVFEKQATDKGSIEFRDSCNKYLTRAETIFSTMGRFDPIRFRKLFKEDINSENTNENLDSLLLKDLFEHYIKTNKKIKLGTKRMIQTSMNSFEKFKPGASVLDVNPDWLEEFERWKLKDGVSINSVGTYMRDLRALINFYMNDEKLIPKTYEYPFGKGGYSIKKMIPKKQVLSDEEIRKVVNYTDFNSNPINPQNPKRITRNKQEYYRDIWLFLYRCNGINFIDLLELRWDNIQGKYITFLRRKTKTTRKNHITPIVVPVTEKLQELIDKIGDPTSPFLLGQIKEDYSEQTFENKHRKLRRQINHGLRDLSEKLQLSVPLKLETARDCYATTLYRKGVSKDEISEMLGHSNSIVTAHYLSTIDLEKTFDINKGIY